MYYHVHSENRKEVDVTEATIKGDANEIAALVVGLQARQLGVVKYQVDANAIAEAATEAIRDMREGTQS